MLKSSCHFFSLEIIYKKIIPKMIEFKSVKKGPVIKKNGKREIMRIIKLPIFDSLFSAFKEIFINLTYI